MGTMNAFYVRAQPESVTAALRTAFPMAKLEAGNGFTSVLMSDQDFEPPRERLAEFSAEFCTDVIWLGFQSVVDAFQFIHWQNGRTLRVLVYGCFGPDERTWEEISGDAEPWEKGAFFDDAQLKQLADDAASEREKQEYERIWLNQVLMPGRMEPMVSSKSAAWVVPHVEGCPGSADRGWKQTRNPRSGSRGQAEEERKRL